MKILVTGASGFIGQKLCDCLLASNHEIIASIRDYKQESFLPKKIKCVHIPSIDSKTNWTEALRGVDVVIHLAARVHVMNETAENPLKEYLITNADGTENIARQAQESGVKKFIFLSTIGVNGDSTSLEPFTEFDNPAPHNPYSTSKKIAEEKLISLAAKKQMQIVIIRAPLVYGKGNRGNLTTLMSAINNGLPLPMYGIQNKKSFLFVGNLVDAIKVCVEHPKARGIYLVSDNEIISTPELIRKVANRLGKPARLFYFPLMLIKFAAKITGNSKALERLVNSLTVNSAKIKYELNWNPPFTLEEGLKEISDSE